MSRRAALLALTALLAGCGGGTPAPPVPAPGPVATPPLASTAPKEPEAGPPLPPKAYEAQQRRDPFVPIVVAEGPKGLTVATVKLSGVIEGRVGHMALIEAPDGIGYIVKVDDTLGDGRVTDIGRDSVTFTVAARPGQKESTVTLRMKTD